ncbi:rhodanese-like domain-containing protein [Flammeovirga kamogawensis]|uniref:Rhodanese-like domain-containing protein n=1 Tax=Flammeovirga kamogawensis TaxID=373891 RepID=A0ABX8GVX9_9BACT|nr:rhodanese-like domain-containing protein [Flammeovirga kamogawensis]MBB6459640.1 rhodanese-related sulfurtransferase [Flammeovirga kamogawensis]QWG07297.1 rhodanese-like domain-containing protein [Flammeovirga kamogawensis]TRX69114.1 rhodanese-like domain-containing protein [Flammeovirga kamogawensis]
MNLNTRFLGLFTALLFAILQSCSPTSSNDPQVTITEFEEIRAAQPEAIIIDVRTPAEYNSGTIEGANNINVLDDSFVPKVSTLDKNQTVMVFCKSGGRSAKAKAQLQELGFTNVVDLEGGIKGWKAADKKVVKP